MKFSFNRQILMVALLVLSSLSSLAAQLTVTWDDNSTGETGFKIERAVDGVNYVQVGTVAANVITFTDTTVVSATTYSYRVAAYNESITSAYSNIASATTGAAVIPTVSPTITSQPVASQTVTAGATVALSVGVSGTPTPTVQWRKNGVAVAGGTSTTLTLTAVSSSDAATYTVVATNSAGQATSNNAYVGVSTATVLPSFTTHPTASQSVSAGVDVVLTAAASGTPTPTYQWMKNGNSISGATATTLTLNAVTTGSAGTYTVRATNSAGSVTSNNAVLNVQAAAPTVVAPAITTQPAASQTVTAGANVTLTVAASGNPTPTYQWRKNDVSISGATGTTLTLNAVTTGSAGTYTVRVTNSAGSVTSNNAVLNVQAAGPFVISPVITTQPAAAQTVTAGANVKLTVAASGNPTPTYQWRKNDVSISGATGTTLTLNAVTTGSAGTYTVRVTNSAGSVTSNNAVLNVQAAAPVATAPVITAQPAASQIVTAGANITLTVAASGSPAPTFQWKKDNTVLEGVTGSTLRIHNSTVLDGGAYTAVAINTAGTVESSRAVVVVQLMPSIPPVTPPPVVQPEVPVVVVPPIVTVPTPSPVIVPPVTLPEESDPIIVTPIVPPLTVPPTDESSGVSPIVVPIPEVSPVPEVPSVEVPVPAETAPVPNPAGSRLMNLSVRAVPGPDDRALLVGFVVRGAAKSMLVRAVGPGLSTYTDMPVFLDPKLTLYAGSSGIASNDNWAGAETLKSTFQRLGAFPLAETSKDAAVLASMAPRSYTVNVTGAGSGLALAEIYDADVASNSIGRLVNLSARAHAGPGDGVLIVGFVISGNTPLRVLIRALGPNLASYGVTTAMADPQLEVYRGNTLIERNDNWAGTNELKTVFAATGASTLPDAGSKDAALIVTLAPGAYTAIVSGVAGTSGIALAEVYEVY